MQINDQYLKLAICELEKYMLSDLQYSKRLREFLDEKIDSQNYLNAKYGFKKFISGYSVARTLAKGDEDKLKILHELKNFRYSNSIPKDIEYLADLIQTKRLSSNTKSGGKSRPVSFCSKYQFIREPDKVMPYDSFALKSLEINVDRKFKSSINEYYQAAKSTKHLFDLHEQDIHQRIDVIKSEDFCDLVEELKLNKRDLINWRITDKYLWAQEFQRKKEIAKNNVHHDQSG